MNPAIKALDTCIVLSHKFNDDDSIDEETKKRLMMGLYHVLDGRSKSLVLSGGIEVKNSVTYAEKMKQRIQEQIHIAAPIYLENQSLDTVGQAIFCRRDIIDPQGFKSFRVITHKYHGQRTQDIFDFVFPASQGYIVDYFGIPLAEDTQEELEKSLHELDSDDAFHRTFEGVEAGDIDAIIRRLYEKHPLYVKNI